MQRYSFLLLILCSCFWACTDKNREAQLQQRELALLQKEKEFALKEADYKSLMKMRDSLLAISDTLQPQKWPVTVAGRWISKVVCNESACGEYVIGDQRSDIWEFVQDSTGIYTKVISNNSNRLIRILSGTIHNEVVLLNYTTDSTVLKAVHIGVTLNSVDSNLIKGTQTITIGANDGCNAKFSVELVRAEKK